MKNNRPDRSFQANTIEKVPSGIKGLDEILNGGVPKERTTLVCGGPGTGKTLLATEFLVRGAQEYNEPGVFMAFEETAEELSKNVASLGFNFNDLIRRHKLFVDYIYIERSEIEETGEYDLEGLFIRLQNAINTIGAKRVVLDTLEVLFAGFGNEAILRSELRRLFRWMKEKKVTAIVTGERGEGLLTRYGLEEYISDCVILLENRVVDKIANRILRVVKYRGSRHGTDEYPFLIGDEGIWVEPLTSLKLDYEISTDRIPTGVSGLDEMLGGKGYYRGASVLVSGAAGTGKTSLAAALVDAACRRGERCLYFAYEESTSQILRNMCSISIDLKPWVDQGLLLVSAARPSFYGVEMHLLTIQRQVDKFQPSIVVLDPLTNLISIGSGSEIKSMLTRMIDYLKTKQITSLFTSLTSGGDTEITTEVGISSLMDTWILLRNLESGGERDRALYVLKSRGMVHSSQIREFILSDRGISLVDVYVGPEGVLTGSARLTQVAKEKTLANSRRSDAERKQREWEHKRKALESQIAALQAEIEAEEGYFQIAIADESAGQDRENSDRLSMAKLRQTGETN